MIAPRFRAVSDYRLELGEGVAWYDGRFLLVDLLTGRLFSLDAGSARIDQLLQLDVPIGAAAPTEGGGLIVAAGHGVALLDGGEVEWLAEPEANASRAMRMNDGSTDPHGAFWATSMAYDNTPGAGSLYRVGPTGDVVKMFGGLTIPNGPVFSADGRRLYLADTARGLILTFGVDPATGELRDEQLFAQVTGGSPDGMTVDAEGYLWSAIWGEGCVHRYTPEGQLSEIITVPARQPTRVALSASVPATLVVTTATYGLSQVGPMDGRVLMADVETPGLAMAPYRVDSRPRE